MNERIEPSRLLFDPVESRQLEYVNAASQSTRGVLATWEWARSSKNPANYPDDSDCNEVDAAGTYKGNA